MADGIIPAQDVLRAILEYDPDTGTPHYKPRPTEMFSTAARADAWNRRYASKRAVSRVDGEGYLHVCLFGSRCRAHRVIWKLIHGDDPKFVDHINGDTSDNRLTNLRNVEFFENCRNRKLSQTNRSGVSGVHWCSTSLRWIARIGNGRDRRGLGAFINFDDAVTARKQAETELGYLARAEFNSGK